MYKLKRKIKKKLIWLNNKKNRYIVGGIVAFLLGISLYIYLGNSYEWKIENLKKELEKDPTSIENCIRLGDYYYKKAINSRDERKVRKYYDEVIKYYRRAIALDKEELISPEIYSRLGIIYFKKSIHLDGNYYYNEALKELEEALNRGYNSYETYLYLGHIYFKNDIFDKAIYNYENALKIKKGDLNALFNIAWSYKCKGDYKTSEEKFREILRKKNITKKIKLNSYLGLGEVYYYLNLNQEALRYLNKALKMNKNFSQARYWLGKIYLRMGKFKEAKREWEKVLKLNPKDRKTKRELETIRIK
jgi:tetratricopeptide (TPR) repeat protein